MITAITNRGISLRPFLEQVRAIAEAEPDMVVLREKDLPRNEYAELARRCLRTCDDNGVRLCVNTFSDVAKDIGVRDVQLPMPVFRAEGAKGFDNVIVSVHSLDEAVEAFGLGADMLMFGNVFEATCKPGAPPKGLDALRGICDAVGAPVLAVGGIDVSNMRSVLSRGAGGLCMMHDFMESERPGEIVLAYRKVWKEARGGTRPQSFL
ncbi:MAG: thiamine phosphate synthase [Candidatus Methanoplasma sp.]|jgi:thiamine-phosphate pyrophosphorylase|nr:thiamine phosphate synthase [Candidatus Methanoplasma sp.]